MRSEWAGHRGGRWRAGGPSPGGAVAMGTAPPRPGPVLGPGSGDLRPGAAGRAEASAGPQHPVWPHCSQAAASHGSRVHPAAHVRRRGEARRRPRGHEATPDGEGAHGAFGTAAQPQMQNTQRFPRPPLPPPPGRRHGAGRSAVYPIGPRVPQHAGRDFLGDYKQQLGEGITEQPPQGSSLWGGGGGLTRSRGGREAPNSVEAMDGAGLAGQSRAVLTAAAGFAAGGGSARRCACP